MQEKAFNEQSELFVSLGVSSRGICLIFFFLPSRKSPERSFYPLLHVLGHS